MVVSSDDRDERLGMLSRIKDPITTELPSPFIVADLSRNVLAPPSRVGASNDTKDYWKKHSLAYRQAATSLKRQSDHTARENTNAVEAALTMQIDAIALFAYSFWCEDQANRALVARNWESLFSLLRFAKHRADKSHLEVLAAICELIDAVVGEVLCHHQRRSLYHRAAHITEPQGKPGGVAEQGPSPADIQNDKQSFDISASGNDKKSSDASTSGNDKKSSDASTSGNDKQSSDASTSGNDKPSSDTSTSVLQSLMRFATDVTRVQRSWGSAVSKLMSPTVLESQFPQTWEAILNHHLYVAPDTDAEPSLPFRHAWPLQLFGRYAVPHTIAFCRELLHEYGSHTAPVYIPKNVHTESD